MSEQHINGSQHEEHRRAAEMHHHAAQAHLAAAEEHSKQHAQSAYLQSEAAHRASRMFRHAEIAARAYALWVARGRPEGSPEEDWFLAAQQLRGDYYDDKSAR